MGTTGTGQIVEQVEKCADCGHYRVINTACMICQLLISNRIDKARLLHNMANCVEQLFTPFAFTCSCGGADTDCKIVMQDSVAINQRETVGRIAEWLHKEAKRLEKKPKA